jgi:hypothetical protein
MNVQELRGHLCAQVNGVLTNRIQKVLLIQPYSYCNCVLIFIYNQNNTVRKDHFLIQYTV